MHIRVFFKELKREISRIKAEKLNYRILSEIYLEKRKWYINDIILRSRGDQNWILKNNMLNLYRMKIAKKGIKSRNIENIFKKYIKNIRYLNKNRFYNQFSN